MKRFFRFSLRTWFILFTLVALVFVAWQNVQERKHLERKIIATATLVYGETRRSEKTQPVRSSLTGFASGMYQSDPQVRLRDSELFPWASQLSKGSVAFCAFDHFSNRQTPPIWLNEILQTGELRTLDLRQLGVDSLDDIRIELIGDRNVQLEQLRILGSYRGSIELGTALRGIERLSKLERLHLLYANADYRQSIPKGLPASLIDVSLVDCGLNDDDMEIFATCVRLQSLDLSRNQCGLGVLADVGLSSKLKTLILKDTAVTKDDLQAVRDCEQLEEINLKGAKIDLRGVDGLTLPKSLVKLIIHESKLDASSFRMLAALPNLETLELNESTFADEDLVGIELPASLKTVGVRGTNAGIHFSKALAGAKKLESLNLHGNQTDDAALQALGAKPELTLLLMNSGQITDASAEWFLPVRKLKRLELIDSAVTDHFFAVAPHLKLVEDLRVYGTQVSLPLREEIRDLDLERYRKQQAQTNKILGTNNNFLPRPKLQLPPTIVE